MRVNDARDSASGTLGTLPELNRILVPLDGTLLSERIFGLARWVPARRNTELVLLSVLKRGEAWAQEQDDTVESTCDYLDWRRHLLLEDYPGRVRYAIRVGDPADEIVQFADEFEPSLIAMATHGRAGLARWRRGSVTETVLRRSRFPVLTANPEGLNAIDELHPVTFRKILVALDGSERSARVLPTVVAIAQLHGSSVTLLHILEVPAAYPPPLVPTTPPFSEGFVLEPWRSALAAAGVSVEAVSIVGSPAATILATVRDRSADLLALATHGRSGLPRLVFGSVAEQVIRHCRCPVLVQRTAELPAEDAGEETSGDAHEDPGASVERTDA